jgi:hypothetical protein
LTRADAATEAAKTYAIALADTVLVPDGGAGGELLTANAARTWTDNAYFFNVRLSCLANILRCTSLKKALRCALDLSAGPTRGLAVCTDCLLRAHSAWLAELRNKPHVHN